MSYDDIAVKAILSGAGTKSEKMRKLNAAGCSRSQIADLLGVRYQFVRNVLVEEERKLNGPASGLAEPKRAWRGEHPEAGDTEKLRVQIDGSVCVPASALAEAGFKPGDRVLFFAKADGEIHLLSRSSGIRRAQELVRQYVPEGVSLVDELIQERRLEATHENGHE